MLTGVYRFELSVAGRVERYSDFGYTTNPKVGAEWAPTKDLSFSGSYGTSFKAPILYTFAPSGRGSFVFSLVDPAVPSGRTNALLIIGNGANLRPETAVTWSAGGKYQPSYLPGFKLETTYFNVDYTDKVIQAAATATLLSDPTYAERIIRSPSAAQILSTVANTVFTGTLPADLRTIGAIADGGYRNAGAINEKGIDIFLSQQLDTNVGRFSFDANATAIFSYKIAQSPTAPQIESVNKINYVPRFRMRTGVSWDWEGFGASATLNYVGGYDNNLVTPVQRVSSWTTLDLQVRYDAPVDLMYGLLRDTTFSVSAINLFNKSPPFVNSPYGIGYDPQNASAAGRLIALQATKRW